MRVLLLTETIPYPLDTGGRIKTFHTLRMLAREHDVRCHAFIREERQRGYSEQLAATGARVTLHLLARTVPREAGYWLQALVDGTPYTVRRHHDATVQRLIAADAEAFRPDLVYCDHLSMMEYARRLDAPIVYDAHNVEHAVLRRFARASPHLSKRVGATFEWRRVRAYERSACRRSRLVFAVSDVDRRALTELAGPEVSICIAPIAVDAASVAALPVLPSTPALLFLGGLHWPPNVDALRFFVRDVWPLVRRLSPDATLTVVGRDDDPLAVECRALPGVTLTGWVEDIAPYVRRSRALVVPMRAGSGMRVKILEAMSRGLPIVSTTVGCEGIDVVSGEHLLIEDDPRAFANAAVRLLAEDDLAASLAAAARRLVLARYDVEVVARVVLDAIRAHCDDHVPAASRTRE
jgi:glycosyltransferase involved in cell wall biosynthesis